MANNASGEPNEIELPQLQSQPSKIDELEIISDGHDEKIGGRKRSKNQKFKRMLKRERQRRREALFHYKDTIALVATLIATFTYSTGVNPLDGPLIGTSVAAHRTAFRVFSVCNNLALCWALSVAFAMISFAPVKNEHLSHMLRTAYRALWLAISFLAAAYVAAVVVIMRPAPPRRGLDWTTVVLLCAFANILGTLILVTGIKNHIVLFRSFVDRTRVKKKINNGGRATETTSDSDETSNKSVIWSCYH
ncbi:hypothetical protein CDL12_03087 [Handroanthus impetiginosus]|uniref:PGG domain-containing protein n=1 Tax=Handroanthus impetiginosus TaxID=429701 RepID=A0A2G9I350_9LAMI|nr:hypothetical protein CDL12_03087 [Handroanthus impetiginosus]